MKKIKGIIAVTCGCAMLTGCNYDVVDTNYTWDTAIITQGGKTITVEVERWMDYGSEQIQIITKDGTTIRTSSYNCMLVRNGEDIVKEYKE